MRRPLRYICAALTAALLAAAAPAEQFGDVAIEHNDPISNYSGSCHTVQGYCEHQFNVSNLSRTDAHQVTLGLPADDVSMRGGLSTLSRTVVVPPGSTVLVRLYQPAIEMYGSPGFGVAIDGKKLNRVLAPAAAMPRHGMRRYWYRAGESIPMLCSQEAGRTLASAKLAPDDWQVYQHRQSPAAWSDNWLGYSRYEVVSMSGVEFRSAPAPVRLALTNYVRAGGLLILQGPSELSDLSLQKDGQRDSYWLGFGRIAVTRDTSDFAEMTKRLVSELKGSAKQQLGTEQANAIMPVIESYQVPVRGMFLMVLVFAMAVGPLNIYVIARKERRLRMLWTVPVMSLVACGLIFGYALFSEGLGVRQRTNALTVLDQETHTATTLGWTGYYSPLTVGRDLKFDYETELTPQVEIDHYYSSQDSSRDMAIDWSSGQTLQRDWIVARAPQYFAFRKVQSRHEQLAFTPTADGGLEVLNGLGSDVTQLDVLWDDGVLYSGRNIPAGAKMTLERLDQGPVEARSAVRMLCRQSWHLAPDAVANAPRDYLVAGSYVAQLAQTVFVEQPVATKEHRQKQVVFGLMRGNHAD